VLFEPEPPQTGEREDKGVVRAEANGPAIDPDFLGRSVAEKLGTP